MTIVKRMFLTVLESVAYEAGKRAPAYFKYVKAKEEAYKQLKQDLSKIPETTEEELTKLFPGSDKL